MGGSDWWLRCLSNRDRRSGCCRRELSVSSYKLQNGNCWKSTDKRNAVARVGQFLMKITKRYLEQFCNNAPHIEIPGITKMFRHICFCIKPRMYNSNQRQRLHGKETSSKGFKRVAKLVNTDASVTLEVSS